MIDRDLGFLIELIKENIHQVSSLRESIDEKFDTMTERSEIQNQKLHDRIDQLNEQHREHEKKFASYDHWLATVKATTAWIVGGGLAGAVALAATVMGFFDNHKH